MIGVKSPSRPVPLLSNREHELLYGSTHSLTHQLWIPFRVHDVYVRQLHVQVLINGVKGAREGHVVLEFHRDLFADQRLKKRIE